MEKHFKISGGELVCKLSNGVTILRRLRLMVIRGDKFEKVIPMKWFSIPRLVEHLIIYTDNRVTYMFNCKDQSVEIINRAINNVETHYVVDNEIYIQFTSFLMRVSDKRTVRIPAKTNYFIKSNSRYTIIAYVSATFDTNTVVWDILSNVKVYNYPLYRDHKLNYKIYETHNLKKICSDTMNIPSPSLGAYFGQISMSEVSDYLKSVSARIQLTDTHIDVYDIRYEYIEQPDDTREKCCICLGKNSMTKLTCGHDVCVSCTSKITSCPSCRDTINGETPQ